MAKAHTTFLCNQCGATFSKWEGKCRECGAWNSLTEFKESSLKSAGGGAGRTKRAMVNVSSELRPLVAPVEAKEAPAIRQSSGFAELDRVLGGGFVKGSLLLFGGEPGIGKSTLLLQVAGSLAAQGRKVLYLSGEESADQVSQRAQRLGIKSSDGLLFLSTSSLDEALGAAEKSGAEFAIVDSVQTLSSDDLESAPGTVSQVREVAHAFMNISKGKGLTTLLVGHVTKDGQVAGPRLLEHMVDGVFYFELASSGGLRWVRGQKNRFGSTNELAVFEMTSGGLAEVPNPSSRFLAERAEGIPGSAIVAHLEGSRPFLTEVQALTQRCYAGYPRRTVQGIDQNRVSVLLAIIEKRLGITVSDQDVYCKVANGARVEEPGADLPILFSVVSSLLGKNIPSDTLLVGEVGLGGELRSVPAMTARIQEARSIGLKKAIVPKSAERDVSSIKGFNISCVRTVQDAHRLLFGNV